MAAAVSWLISAIILICEEASFSLALSLFGAIFWIAANCYSYELRHVEIASLTALQQQPALQPKVTKVDGSDEFQFVRI